MAEPEEGSAAEGGAPARARGVPPIVMILLVVCCVASLAVSVVALLSRSKAHAATKSKAKAKPKAVVERPRERHDLGEFMVNLSDTDGQAFLKATLVLEFELNEKEKKGGHGEGSAAPEWDAPVRDAIVGILSESSRAELRSEGGKERLKKRIIARINHGEGGHGPKFVAVYLTSFAMQ